MIPPPPPPEHPAIPRLRSILPEVTQEAIRAHAKHGDHSMLNPAQAPHRLAHLVEEVGEVAFELSEGAQGRPRRPDRLRAELIQVAHVALAWAVCLDLDLDLGP